MPCEDVWVYGVSCIKSVHIGGKTPRYLGGFALRGKTDPQVYETVTWYHQLNDYTAAH